MNHPLKRAFHNHFARYQPAEVEHSPYPMWVTLKDGSQVIVKDAEEHAKITGEHLEQEISTENERERLLQAAERIGLKVDRRWGLDRLRSVVESQGR